MSGIYHVDQGSYHGRGPDPLCGATLRRPRQLESRPDGGQVCPACQALVDEQQRRILAMGQVYEAFKDCWFVQERRS